MISLKAGYSNCAFVCYHLCSLADFITGRLIYDQPNLLPSAKERNFTSTTSETNITAQISFPSFYNSSEIIYEWDINNQTTVEKGINFILYNFTKAQVNNISLLVKAIQSDPPLNTTGLFILNLTSVEPISNISLDGKTFMPRYEMLNLNLEIIGGEPPFFYCWKFQHVSSNEPMGDHSETCDEADTKSFKIVRYFGIKGKYNLTIEIMNPVTKLIRAWTISIYEGIYI